MKSPQNIGIESMGVGFTRHYLPLRALAEARGIEAAKFEKGLGCLAMAVPQPTEDTVTLAAAAGEAALLDGKIDPLDIGILIVGTETAVDQAKPVASYVQGLLGVSQACRVYEIKHACYGATAGILTAAQWIASGANRGKKALVIAADIARYGVKTAGEPTQGAGAAAMVISDAPKLVSLDYQNTGAWSRDVHDFWRPLGSPDALVDGAFSLECYLEGIRESFKQYADGRDLRVLEEGFDALLLHVPFVKMTDKGHKALLGLTREGVSESETAESYQTRIRPTLRLAEQVGNAYTASLWLALASLIESGSYEPGAKLGFYSYGSGFCAEFFAGTLMRSGAGTISSFAGLSQRAAIDVATYERWMAERLEAKEVIVPEASALSPFAFVGVKDHKRQYERIAVSV